MKHAAAVCLALAIVGLLMFPAIHDRESGTRFRSRIVRSSGTPNCVAVDAVALLLPGLMPRPPPCPAVLAGDGPLAGAGRPAGGGLTTVLT